MNIKMSNNAEKKLWYYSIEKEEVLETILKGKEIVDEKGISHFIYGELNIIANVDKINNVTDVITVRYSRKIQGRAKRVAKRNGIHLHTAFKLLKGKLSSQFEQLTNHTITIEPYQDCDFKGIVARYNEIPVEVFGTDEKQVLEDLYYAKLEYYATLEKESK